MLKDLIHKLGSLVSDRGTVDPSRFNDPLALTVAWTPNRRGGANFCTHRLAQINPERLEFRATASMSLFCVVFIVIGLVVAIAIPAAQWFRGVWTFQPSLLAPLLVGALFAVIGTGMLFSSRKPIVFDKRGGFYWKGRSSPQESFNPSAVKECAELKTIHALQIISERCSSKNGSYYSYELNLVLGDGRRITAVDHGSYPKLREDAEKLSSFLGKPLWDAIEQ